MDHSILLLPFLSFFFFFFFSFFFSRNLSHPEDQEDEHVGAVQLEGCPTFGAVADPAQAAIEIPGREETMFVRKGGERRRKEENMKKKRQCLYARETTATTSCEMVKQNSVSTTGLCSVELGSPQ